MELMIGILFIAENPLLAIFVGLALLSLVLNIWVVPRLWGWPAFHQKFKVPEDYSQPQGSYGGNWRTIHVGKLRFRNAVRVEASALGLYIRPVLIIRLIYRPVLVPWIAVRNAKEKSIFGFSLVELEVDGGKIRTISLPLSLWDDCVPYVANPDLDTYLRDE
jgi:hypothetical protein